MGSETITFKTIKQHGQSVQQNWAVRLLPLETIQQHWQRDCYFSRQSNMMGSQTITFGDNPTALAVRLLLFETIQQHRQSDCYFSRQPNMMGSQTITFQGNPTTWAGSPTAWAVSPTAWAVRLLPFETIQRHG